MRRHMMMAMIREKLRKNTEWHWSQLQTYISCGIYSYEINEMKSMNERNHQY